MLSQNNSPKDPEGLLKSDPFIASVLKAALSIGNLFLVKHIIDLMPGFVNHEFSSAGDAELGIKPFTSLSYAIRARGFGAECNNTALAIVTFLCSRGADVNRFIDSKTPYRDIRKGNTVHLYSAAERASEKNLEFVKTLICFGARLPDFPTLPKDRHQKYQPENLAVRDIPTPMISTVEEHVKKAWDALYAEHRNIYLVKFSYDKNSEFKGFPPEVFMHFTRTSIEHCYKSKY